MASRNYMQRNFRSPRPRERPPITPVLRVAVQGSEIVVTASDTGLRDDLSQAGEFASASR